MVRDHRLMGVYLCTMFKDKASSKNQSSKVSNSAGFAKSKIQITINHGPSLIIIKNDSRTNSATMEIPQIPYRARKDFKIKAMQQNNATTKSQLNQQSAASQPNDSSQMIYRTVLQVNDANGYFPSSQSKADYYEKNTQISKMLKQSNPLNRNFLVKTLFNENVEFEESAKQQSDIYGMIKPTKPYNGPQKELSDRAKCSKKQTLTNPSTTQRLLGSLRSRSKERSNYNDEKAATKNGGGKFKTISNPTSGSHSRVTSTKSDSIEQQQQQLSNERQKLDRSQKGSKSFRDQRNSQNLESTTGHKTWDSFYGSGIKLLKNISFVRTKSQSKVDHDPTRRLSDESSESSNGNSSSRNMSLSEPNLHKSNRNRIRNKSTSKDEPQQQHIERRTSATSSTNKSEHGEKSINSKSTPLLTNGNQRYSEERQRSTENIVSTVSTPSLLYRLSNPVSSSGGGGGNGSLLTMRSISTSSLRTRRRAPTEPPGRQHNQQFLNAESTVNGEWQKMAPRQESPILGIICTNNKCISSKIENIYLLTGSPAWSRKPSSLRISVSDTSSTNVLSTPTSKNINTSSHYHREVMV